MTVRVRCFAPNRGGTARLPGEPVPDVPPIPGWEPESELPPSDEDEEKSIEIANEVRRQLGAGPVGGPAVSDPSNN
jgi:hypothetical protein